MIDFSRHTELNYSQFQKLMDLQFEKCGLTEIEIALKVGLKSTATIRNAFRKDTQIVSDEVMTKVMHEIGLNGFIVWDNGKRCYFAK